jgi:hypothetical protein
MEQPAMECIGTIEQVVGAAAAGLMGGGILLTPLTQAEPNPCVVGSQFTKLNIAQQQQNNGNGGGGVDIAFRNNGGGSNHSHYQQQMIEETVDALSFFSKKEGGNNKDPEGAAVKEQGETEMKIDDGDSKGFW